MLVFVFRERSTVTLVYDYFTMLDGYHLLLSDEEAEQFVWGGADRE